LIHADDRASVRDVILKALKQEIDFTAQFRMIWPDGSVHYLAIRGKGFYEEAGRPLRMTCVTVNITDRKQAEEIRSFLVAIVESTTTQSSACFAPERPGSWRSSRKRFRGAEI